MVALKIPQATSKGYIECPVGGVFDWAYPNSKNRRGRVQGVGMIAPTLTCTSVLLLFEGYEED